MIPPHKRDEAALSPLAQHYLAQLTRTRPVPTSKVERLLLDEGWPRFEAWVSFHERYAGYVQLSGSEFFVWGLVHKDPQWLPPGEPDVDKEPNKNVWYVACADGHPSYNYRLDQKGTFLGGPSRTFDIFVERLALIWEFKRSGPCHAIPQPRLKWLSRQKLFWAHVGPGLAREACDEYANWYMTQIYLIREDLVAKTLTGWKR